MKTIHVDPTVVAAIIEPVAHKAVCAGEAVLSNVNLRRE